MLPFERVTSLLARLVLLDDQRLQRRLAEDERKAIHDVDHVIGDRRQVPREVGRADLRVALGLGLGLTLHVVVVGCSKSIAG